jgi:hypothetical protein
MEFNIRKFYSILPGCLVMVKVEENDGHIRMLYAFLHTSECYMHSCTHQNAICISAHIRMLYAFLHTSGCYIHFCTHRNAICISAHTGMLYAFLHTSECYMHFCTHRNAICIPAHISSVNHRIVSGEETNDSRKVVWKNKLHILYEV